MNLEKKELKERANGHCELCNAAADLSVYEVQPSSGNTPERAIYLCEKCIAQLDKKQELDPAHWQCLSTSMWSEVAPVQVAAWRILNRLKTEAWAADLLEMLYLTEENLEWAKATGDHEDGGVVDLHKDAFGNQLLTGDTVVLTQSLDVKGSTVNARQGTVVKNIRLVPDNTEQVEGKIDGQTIVILSKYLKKQGG